MCPHQCTGQSESEKAMQTVIFWLSSFSTYIHGTPVRACSNTVSHGGHALQILILGAVIAAVEQENASNTYSHVATKGNK